MSINDSITINFSNIISVVVVILGCLVLYSIINPVFNTTVKTLTKVVYINEKEGMKSMTGTTSFCDSYKTDLNALEKKCNEFNKSTCNSASCCVWLNTEKCTAGDVNGPTFQTDNNGKKINLDYYYYMNNCKGEKCPK